MKTRAQRRWIVDQQIIERNRRSQEAPEQHSDGCSPDRSRREPEWMRRARQNRLPAKVYA